MKLLGPRGPCHQPIGPKGGGEKVLGNAKLEAKYMCHCLCLLSYDQWHARALDMLKLVPVIAVEVHAVKRYEKPGCSLSERKAAWNLGIGMWLQGSCQVRAVSP